ncbi:MAG: class I SAM-dependent methyltransferase [Deltaproteobacteria bacterium]|nr:class I SAM-dependent methyltransferase [Deltaproteobacteria bacterium]
MPKKENRTRYMPEAFWNVLVDVFEKLNSGEGYQLPEGPVNILNLGCGACFEGRVLNSFFGGEHLGQLSAHCFVTGIDPDEEAILQARLKHQDDKGADLPNFRFITDAVKKDSAKLPTLFDVVIMRHHNGGMTGSEADWFDIFKFGMEHLTDNGVLIVTSYNEVEYSISKRWPYLWRDKKFTPRIVADIPHRRHVEHISWPLVGYHPETWYEDGYCVAFRKTSNK